MAEIIVVGFFFLVVIIFFLFTYLRTKKKTDAKKKSFFDLIEALKNEVQKTTEVEQLRILLRDIMSTKKKFIRKGEYYRKFDQVIKLAEDKIEALRKNKSQNNKSV